MAEVHVVPSWQVHELRSPCWCQPYRYPPDPVTGKALVTHRCANDDPTHYPEEVDPAAKAFGRFWDTVTVS